MPGFTPFLPQDKSKSYDTFTYGHDPSYQDIEDFPSWLQDSGTGSLQQFQQQLPNYFNMGQLRRQTNRATDSNFEHARAAMMAAATAAQNRARQAGGAVNASFAAAGGLTPLYQQKNDQNAKLAQMMAALRAQQASLAGSAASNLTSANLQHQGILSDYTLNAQRLAQQKDQFNQQLGLMGSGGGGGGSGGGNGNGVFFPGYYSTDQFGKGMNPQDEIFRQSYQRQVQNLGYPSSNNYGSGGGITRSGLTYSTR